MDNLSDFSNKQYCVKYLMNILKSTTVNIFCKIIKNILKLTAVIY